MKVLFIKHLRGKGSIGDIKEVPDGYGTNFLITQGYAVKATEEIIKKYKQAQQEKEKEEQEELMKIKEIINFINGKQIIIYVAQKDQSGKLYKSISINELLIEVKKQLGVQLQKNFIQYQKPIKEIGNHTILIQYKNIAGKINIDIK